MLTRKQLELLLFINERLKEEGVPPSFEEMKDALNLQSKSGVHRLIVALEERGFRKRMAHRSRELTMGVPIHAVYTPKWNSFRGQTNLELDLIDFLPDSEGKPSLASFQGRRVVVDDSLPTRAGTTDGTVYTTYLFGQGAFAKGVAPLSGTPLQGGIGTEGVELARVPLDSDTLLINRRRYILHPRGVKFTSASVAADSPTAAELETAANWVRVWENKNVRLVAITHNN